MTQEEYFKLRKGLKSQLPKIKFGEKPNDEQKETISRVNAELKDLVEDYIEKAKPCNKNDHVEMILHSGRRVRGIVTDFGILHDGNVHPVAYKVGSSVKHISSPIQSLKLI